MAKAAKALTKVNWRSRTTYIGLVALAVSLLENVWTDQGFQARGLLEFMTDIKTFVGASAVTLRAAI